MGGQGVVFPSLPSRPATCPPRPPGIPSQPINTLRLGNMMAVQISTPA